MLQKGQSSCLFYLLRLQVIALVNQGTPERVRSAYIVSLARNLSSDVVREYSAG